MKHIISASLSPNAQPDDVRLAAGILFRPALWKRGAATERVAGWFSGRYHTPHAYLFNSGRSALLALLQAYGIGQGDEVIVQAFTCVAVPNSVLWCGATPVYADIDASYNLDPESVAHRISPKTKAVIVQHTFGIPADMDALRAVVWRQGILLIEDCAHGLGAVYKGKPLGSWGDAAFFSFGRDKAVSSVWGGAAIIHKKRRIENRELRTVIQPYQEQAADRLKEFHDAMPVPSYVWIFRQLLHPLAFSMILPLYTSGIGKVLLVFLQKIRLLSFPVFPEEKYGRKPRMFPARYPNALAILIEKQLSKLEAYTRMRRRTAETYRKVLPPDIRPVGEHPGSQPSWLRFPIEVSDPDGLAAQAKQQGILLGKWYRHIIDPAGVDLTAVGYNPGTCPRAERAGRVMVNLPTLIPATDAQRVVAVCSRL